MNNISVLYSEEELALSVKKLGAEITEEYKGKKLLVVCVAAITGAVDTITDGKRVARISNGHPYLSKVTGTGCMTTGLVGSFAGACDDMYTAAVTGIASMGIAGEFAYENAGEIGSGSFHISIIDAISKMNSQVFAAKARIEEA